MALLKTIDRYEESFGKEEKRLLKEADTRETRIIDTIYLQIEHYTLDLDIFTFTKKVKEAIIQIYQQLLLIQTV